MEDIRPEEQKPWRPKVADKEDVIVGLEPDHEEKEDVEDESQPEEPPSQEKDIPERALAYLTVKLLNFL